MKRGKHFFVESLCCLPLLFSCGGTTTSSAPVSTPVSSDTASSSSGREITPESSWSLHSTDSSLIIDVTLSTNGSVFYDVKKNGCAVINSSKMGFVFSEADLSSFLTFKEKSERSNVAVSYTNITGKKKNVSTEFNELKLTFLEFDYYLDVTFRAYPDGFAFRYDVRTANDTAAKTVNWEQECTEFALPDKSKTYAMPFKPSGTSSEGLNWFSYEDYYSYRRSDRLGTDSYAFPFTYVTEDNVHCLLSESQLIGSGYHGSFLQNDADGYLQTVHSPASGKAPDKTIDMNFESPWRVGIVGTLNTIVESTLVEDVYGENDFWKPDNYNDLSADDQKIYDYSWVEPGVTAWSWLYYNGTTAQNDFTLQRKYIDLASTMGWKYSILDGGWSSGRTDTEIKDLCTYAHSKGVKMIAWGDAINDFGTLSTMRVRLKNWKSLGIDGVKVDFWDGQTATNAPQAQMEDKQNIKHYEDFYQTTASLQMVVNCHGANKPTGERRRYPNVINREAVRGNEFKSVATDQTVFDSLIRSSIGPTDFTPTVKPYRKGITAAHDMALTITMESGSPSMSDVSTRYLEDNYQSFYKALPAVWDETKLLEGNLETHAIIARRNGDNWWIGGITARDALNPTLDLSFLGTGSYKATLYSDNGTTGSNSTVAVSTSTMDASSKPTMAIEANGGFALTLIKQ